MNPEFIYHITTRKHWDDFSEMAYFIDEHNMKDGFIHCCTLEQVNGVLSRFFSEVTDPLVLLTIDTTKLPSRLEFEAANDSDELFPHVYGLIPTKLIIDVKEINTKLI
jgi:uncharacterized protein (DUF952 family)